MLQHLPCPIFADVRRRNVLCRSEVARKKGVLQSFWLMVDKSITQLQNVITVSFSVFRHS